MKKKITLSVLIASLSLFFISFAGVRNHSTIIASSDYKMHKTNSSVAHAKDALGSVIYDSLKLEQAGLTKQAVDYAVKGYEKLSDSGIVANPYLTIVDLSQSSRKKRFYILDMKNYKLVLNTFVAHGKNSGVDSAENFSNQLNSDESSLGFYLTEATYSGKHGLSLRLGGLENGFNNNAEARGIVVHGAPYVNATRVNSNYMGRSQGCPALPENEYAKVINIIKGGSVLFVYHPSEDYLQGSNLLNS